MALLNYRSPEEKDLPLRGGLLREWRADELPRERLLNHGAHTLSDVELIAILLGTGTRGHSAVDAARELLNKSGDLATLMSRDTSELSSVRGVARVKAIKLAAAFELSRRVQTAPFQSRRVIRSPADVASYYIPRLRAALRESFRVLLMNSANQVFRESVVSEGSLNASIVHPREVFRTAISESAASVILLHNHPSGNAEPSREDIAVTKQLRDAGAIIDIKVLDHVIIAGETFTSFSERGLM